MDHCYKSFVSLGNSQQSFLRLLNAVKAHLDLLPKPILIQAGNTPFECEGCDVVDFIGMDEFKNCISDAEVLIFHGGAGSVLNAIRVNKRPIVMARHLSHNECVNDHQVVFAKKLNSLGKLQHVTDAESLRQAIDQVLKEGISFDAQKDASDFEGLQLIKERIQKLLA